MKSLKTKLIATYAAVVAVVMIASGTFMLYNVRDMEIGHAYERLSSLARLINDQIVQVYERESFWDAGAWGILMQSEYDIESVLLNHMGIPIAPAEFVWLGYNFNDRSVISAMATGQESFYVGSAGLDRDGQEQQWMTFAMPVSARGEDFIILVRLSLRFLNESMSSLTFYLVMMVLFALILTVAIWFFLGNRLTQPIIALSRHARGMAGGDFAAEIEKIDTEAADEIGELARSFAYMARELKATMSGITSEKNKSEAILQNTSHGVLAYDSAGHLIHANNASVELLSGIEFDNGYLGDALSLLNFSAAEVYGLDPGSVLESIYEDNDCVLLAGVTSYTSNDGQIDGFVIVLQDITRQRKLDDMRKEFVANVSHELRTPLTNISTYAETLLDGALHDKNAAERFLRVICDEAGRMSLLVSDLLELSRIDSGTPGDDMEAVDLGALLAHSIKMSQIQADKKSQAIAFEPLGSAGPCFVEASAVRLGQVMANILSNSVKYSPEGTRITVSMEATEKFYRVFVKDQGIGIPQESLGRVFERFYRVDKARARAMGGTGLGLAIVKEIVEEHGGRVHISSAAGQGTTVTLRFNRLQEA